MKKRQIDEEYSAKTLKKQEFSEFTKDISDDLRDILESWDNSIEEWIGITKKYPGLAPIMKSRSFIERCKWKGTLPIGKRYSAEEVKHEGDIEPRIESDEWARDLNAPKWQGEFLWIKHLELNIEIEATPVEKNPFNNRHGFYWIAKQLQLLFNLEYLEITFILINDIEKIDRPCSPIPLILYNPNKRDPFFSNLKKLVLRNMWNGYQWGNTFYCPSLQYLEIYGLKGADGNKNPPHAQELDFGFKHLKQLTVLCTNMYALFGNTYYVTQIKKTYEDARIDEVHYECSETMAKTTFDWCTPLFTPNRSIKVELLDLPPITNVIINTDTLEIQNTNVIFSEKQPKMKTLILHDDKSITIFPSIEVIEIPLGLLKQEKLDKLIQSGIDVIELEDADIQPMKIGNIASEILNTPMKQKDVTDFPVIQKTKAEYDTIMKSLTNEENKWLEKWIPNVDEVSYMRNIPTNTLKTLIKTPYFIATHPWILRRGTGILYPKIRKQIDLYEIRNDFIAYITKLTVYLEIEVATKSERSKHNGYIYDIGLMLESMTLLSDLTIIFNYPDRSYPDRLLGQSYNVSPCLNVDYIFNPERTPFKFLNLKSLKLVNVINTSMPEKMYAAKFKSLKSLEMIGANDIPDSLKPMFKKEHLSSGIFDSGTKLKLSFTKYFGIYGNLDITRFETTNIICQKIVQKDLLELHTGKSTRTNSVMVEGFIMISIVGNLNSLALKGSPVLAPPKFLELSGNVKRVVLLNYSARFGELTNALTIYNVGIVVYDTPESLKPLGLAIVKELSRRGVIFISVRQLLQKNTKITPISIEGKKSRPKQLVSLLQFFE